MAKSNRQHVFEGLELLPAAMTPFVEKRLESSLSGHWQKELAARLHNVRFGPNGGIEWDQPALFNAMDRFWNEAFRPVLGRAHRSLVNELVEVRNDLSHNKTFSYDDAERALDSMRRLTEAIGAGEAAEQLGRMRDTILRTKYTELQRNEERRKTRRTEIAVETAAGLLPWREVVEPHPDVATGDFLQAEFAADLGKVRNGSAPSEYGDPKEFFARTYLTDGLSDLLIGAARRLSGTGGDPVVELQTNFGGGKTHSMLALYHMTGDTPAQEIPGLDRLLADLPVPENISRAVLVGTSRGPQDVLDRDGRKIRTTWGELAWQLGGEAAYGRIAENDERGVAPGSNLLEEIFRASAPCLILIDEWVAYLRQIYRTDGLPSGSFDANLSFVQSLTEAVKASPGTLLVATLPASQIEVGGEGGQEALTRLKQTFSRVGSSWRPASQEESYEIVRRRLFRQVSGDRFPNRDNVLKQFAKLYRENSNDFPQGCAEEDYRRKLEKAYPIHPELFEQLYTGWGSLEKFQRTRGVLRLMAQVVHELWMNNDPSVMIMPGSVAIGSERVEPELRHYLEENWQSVVAGDVDGTSSTPYRIDQGAPNLNRHSATRRVARTVFMGTAPTYKLDNPGVDDKRINLGVVQPGERPAVFGDALRRLANQAKFLHNDTGRYWYSTAPSLNRLASDRALQIEEALVVLEIDKLLTAHVNGIADRSHFDAVQAAPGSSADIPDESGGVRAVVLGISHPHSARGESDALTAAKEMLMQRGSVPRVYRNMLVFMAADVRQLDGLREAMRLMLAWSGIVDDTERLNLTQSDSVLAREKKEQARETMMARLKEAWSYLIYPVQDGAQADISWSAVRIPAQDGLLARAGKRLVSDEGLLTELGPGRLERDLQRYVWGENPHLSLKDLWEYLNRYVYLPRLKDRQVLIGAVRTAISGMVPGPFAFAERWDGEAYHGLLIENAQNAAVVIDGDSVLVRPAVAENHRPVPADPEKPTTALKDKPEPVKTQPDPTRFVGTVEISADRPAHEFRQIVEAIVEQLTVAPGSRVSLKLEIDAEVPDGLDRGKVRTLTENANTLGFIEKSIR